jgi:flagellar motor switch protein FliN/FliY
MTTDFGQQLPELTTGTAEPASPGPQPAGLATAVLRIPVSVQVVIGTARVPLAEVARLGPGSTLTLEEKLGTPARVLVNGREVAKGELFVLDGGENRLGLTITDVTGDGPAAA